MIHVNGNILADVFYSPDDGGHYGEVFDRQGKVLGYTIVFADPQDAFDAIKRGDYNMEN
jgi:hypothetical protein